MAPALTAAVILLGEARASCTRISPIVFSSQSRGMIAIEGEKLAAHHPNSSSPARTIPKFRQLSRILSREPRRETGQTGPFPSFVEACSKPSEV